MCYKHFPIPLYNMLDTCLIIIIMIIITKNSICIRHISSNKTIQRCITRVSGIKCITQCHKDDLQYVRYGYKMCNTMSQR